MCVIVILGGDAAKLAFRQNLLGLGCRNACPAELRGSIEESLPLRLSAFVGKEGKGVGGAWVVVLIDNDVGSPIAAVSSTPNLKGAAFLVGVGVLPLPLLLGELAVVFLLAVAPVAASNLEADRPSPPPFNEAIAFGEGPVGEAVEGAELAGKELPGERRAEGRLPGGRRRWHRSL